MGVRRCLFPRRPAKRDIVGNFQPAANVFRILKRNKNQTEIKKIKILIIKLEKKVLPVVLCLKELELIFDAITRVRGGELESLSGLSRCLVTEITRKDFRDVTTEYRYNPLFSRFASKCVTNISG